MKIGVLDERARWKVKVWAWGGIQNLIPNLPAGLTTLSLSLTLTHTHFFLFLFSRQNHLLILYYY